MPSLEVCVRRDPHPGVIVLVVVLDGICDPHGPRALAWASLERGVVAYRRLDWTDSVDAAAESLLEHLSYGSDNPVVEAADCAAHWRPMPEAPLAPILLWQELSRDLISAGKTNPIGANWALLEIPEAMTVLVQSLQSRVANLFRDGQGWSTEFNCFNYNLFVSEDEQRGRNRLQAVTALAWLKHSIFRPLPASWLTAGAARPEGRSPLLKSIDVGRPLFQEIARLSGVPLAIVRRSRRLSFITSEGESIPGLLRTIYESTGIDRYPDPLDEKYLRITWHWLRYLGLSRQLFPRLATAGHKRIAAMLSPYFEDDLWLGTCQSFHPEVHGHPNSFKLADEFLNALHECARAIPEAGDDPAMALGKIDVRRLVEAWLQEKGLKSYMAAADQWHSLTQDIGGLGSADWQGEMDANWMPILAERFSVGERTIVELNCAADLAEEGLAMCHCVGGLVPQALSGARFFSVRSMADVRLSTLQLDPEVSVSEGQMRVSGFWIAELRGPANAVASEGCRSAAAELVRVLGSDAYRDRMALIKVAHTPRWLGRAAVERVLIDRRGRPRFGPLWNALFVPLDRAGSESCR